jgi:hypothetical protein
MVGALGVPSADLFLVRDPGGIIGATRVRGFVERAEHEML